ncbi:ferrochelatase [Chlamydia abortus]|uniref:Ferrochelatase n=1 Tax=Chlamydia abortus (strain DSM 27085 / S26/3) TaxID=218497 RepID=HEMH_CHLAB|nr:ferrochelatase [Chlamydia abortus]Q5L6X6.1 RecName: Full=Ferrochelatase; AltName: Full=Heme synthase; AltName: Full=Protoheme ferro-lyase [Chlamydia abortus S26/3]ASD30326.1 ferrochelatase [Chlamydia abortus]AUS59566.1 ferrochelatase/ protoheme ferro-lyase [Chlamydia abortus]QRR31852.1 ferrochelatase [Chlamydia abortus]CAH63594.1 putative ferrochelatase [Chlamydia abortus S26/3]CED80199.1 putative ferrochelatase [Chlamydia abortus]
MVSTYLLANFGGPRHSHDVEVFLTSLLTDRDVTGGCLPSFLHKRLFSFIAKKRAPKVVPQYNCIGGYSPIYQDTEALAKTLSSHLDAPVITFHRYLPDTHSQTIQQLKTLGDLPVVGVPLFPHFTYAVTGSIVRFIHNHLPSLNISWVAHFGNHPQFISCMIDHILEFLQSHDIPTHDCCLLFSAHGLPMRYVNKGDPYNVQCEKSFAAISERLPNIETFLCYQSKFGLGKWLTPSTKEVCKTLKTNKKYVLIVPFGFTSDHIETLYEIEKEYIAILIDRKYQALRVPAIYQSPQWVQSLATIIQSTRYVEKHSLIKS